MTTPSLAATPALVAPRTTSVELDAGALSLDRLRSGQQGRVTAVQGHRALRRRLLEMGLSPGVTVEAVRRAPLGDPIQFLVRGYHLCLRREDARHILIRVEPR